jgi:hypothetical protein
MGDEYPTRSLKWRRWLALGWLVIALSPCQAAEQTKSRYEKFLFGVCYYPEQWPESYWEEDARRMEECGVNTVRMGEFGWAVVEPREGHYDFSLFDRAIATLGRHGIKVIFGTPTATPPKWLTQKHPEVLHVFESGQPADDHVFAVALSPATVTESAKADIPGSTTRRANSGNAAESK